MWISSLRHTFACLWRLSMPVGSILLIYLLANFEQRLLRHGEEGLLDLWLDKLDAVETVRSVDAASRYKSCGRHRPSCDV